MENWELKGYGTAIYTNIIYPFVPVDPPFVPDDDNPVGCYIKEFDIPADWKDQKVILHFGGVSSAFYVWLNGQFIGYSEDSRLPAEFDITPFVQKNDNKLAVKVYRFSDGSYLEDQDMWFLSGIFRSVRLLAFPPVFIRDIQLESKFIDDFSQVDVVVAAEVFFHQQDQPQENELQCTAVLQYAGEELARTDQRFLISADQTKKLTTLLSVKTIKTRVRP